ncbi:MAG: hypothetical protein E4H02_07385 [Lentisphaerales bacterium]|nr:MAG: hypothetical protein E4H02_07385 [Lentisphaerales bacterium]
MTEKMFCACIIHGDGVCRCTKEDSSAIVPLLVQEKSSATFLDILKADPDDIVVWWGSSTECISALCRREREGAFSSRQISTALPKKPPKKYHWAIHSVKCEDPDTPRETERQNACFLFSRSDPEKANDPFNGV